MSSNFDRLVYDAPDGLVPYLESTLGGEWGQFQLRRYGQLQGIRPGRDSVQTLGKHTIARNVTQALTIGFIIAVNNLDPDSSIKMAVTFRDAIDSAILTWQSTKAVGLLREDIDQITGITDLEQAKGQASSTQGCWNIVCVREFDIVYLVD